jgi:uncharacterized repeat protein (TIGR03837 family)
LNPSKQARCDIFCRVVDNYGDIGVCWRLARQLAREFAVSPRLIVDDLESLRKIAPEVDIASTSRRAAGVEIIAWAESHNLAPVDWVIEAFGCEIPDAYVNAMRELADKPAWINLEYLSAESWIDENHLLPSPQPAGTLTKYFFFPGFTPSSGGLIREADLLARRRLATHRPPGRPARIFIFCYANRALPALLDAFASMPEMGGCTLAAGTQAPMSAMRPGWVRMQDLVPQPDFDALLWQFDILFVRGEDSAVRAQWAGKPFVWHIYPQADGAHWAKLEAFLQIYEVGLSSQASGAVRDLWMAWNREDTDAIQPAWRAFASSLPELTQHAEQWTGKLAQMPDLTTNLVTFCRKNAKI